MRQKLLIGVILALGLAASGAWADEWYLSASGLVDPSATSFIYGDKTFSNFTCSIVINGDAAPSNCNQIKVKTSTDLSGNLGVLFQAAFNAQNYLGAPGSVDILLGYTVTASAAYITDLHMTFNGFAHDGGTTDVAEDVYSGTASVDQIDVYNPPPVLEISRILSGGPYTSLIVTKDIRLNSGNDPNGGASISSIGQYFSQSSVPEPASIMFLGTILLGCASLLRRRLNG